MKITITTDQGTVVETIEHVQDYNLDRPIASGVLMDEIKDAVRRGVEMEMEEEGPA